MSSANQNRRSNQNNRRRNQVVVRQYTSPTVRMPNFPPNYNAAIIVRHTFRYGALASGTSVITPQNVMNIMTFYAGPTAASNYALFSAYRVKSIKMWGFTGANTLSRLSLEFQTPLTGPVGSKPRVYSASSAGTAMPAKIYAKPQKGTSAADWQNSLTAATTTTGFQVILVYQENTTIDIKLELVLNNGDPVTTTPYIGSLTPVNQIYANNLDSTSLPSNLSPIGKSPNK